MVFTEVGKALKAYRTAQQFRQKEIAENLGITREYYSAIENGRKQPSRVLLETIISICNVRLLSYYAVNNKPVNQ